jgi:hypothetical protein
MEIGNSPNDLIGTRIIIKENRITAQEETIFL